MKESVRIIRFAIIGTLNALIAAFVVWLLMHIEGESYIIANICAYMWHRYITLSGANTGFFRLKQMTKK